MQIHGLGDAWQTVKRLASDAGQSIAALPGKTLNSELAAKCANVVAKPFKALGEMVRSSFSSLNFNAQKDVKSNPKMPNPPSPSSTRQSVNTTASSSESVTTPNPTSEIPSRVHLGPLPPTPKSSPQSHMQFLGSSSGIPPHLQHLQNFGASQPTQHTQASAPVAKNPSSGVQAQPRNSGQQKAGGPKYDRTNLSNFVQTGNSLDRLEIPKMTQQEAHEDLKKYVDPRHNNTDATFALLRFSERTGTYVLEKRIFLSGTEGYKYEGKVLGNLNISENNIKALEQQNGVILINNYLPELRDRQ